MSFDGTGQKRGHSSHNGVASVLDLVTGFPVEFEILSNYCNKCKIAEGLPDDAEWKAKHSVNCIKTLMEQPMPWKLNVLNVSGVGQ